jgi:hypothetical protein
MPTRLTETDTAPRRKPWVPALALVAMAAVALVVAFPGIVKTRRAAAAAACMENLPRLYKAISLYQADNSGMLPPSNPDRTEYWETVAHGGYAPPRTRVHPFAKYEKGLDSTKCPLDGHAYTLRFSVSMAPLFDVETKPNEIRVIDPQPGTVLAECHTHLDKGYSHKLFGSASTYAAMAANREGFHHVLRADGSVDRVDAKSVRQVAWSKRGPSESWVESSPRTDLGTPWEVFPGEPWPPKWAYRWKP